MNERAPDDRTAQHPGAPRGADTGPLQSPSTLTGRLVGAASNSLRHARRVIILVVGITVVAIGVAMMVLPGPAFIVIPVGLGILATEFLWARRLLQSLKDRARSLLPGNGKT